MIYISGPMLGIKDMNYPKFNKVEKKLTKKGFEVFNPAKVIFNKTGMSEKEVYDKYMELDLLGLERCSSIYLLKGWHKSHGAKVELKRAVKLGLVIEFEDIFSFKDLTFFVSIMAVLSFILEVCCG